MSAHVNTFNLLNNIINEPMMKSLPTGQVPEFTIFILSVDLKPQISYFTVESVTK